MKILTEILEFKINISMYKITPNYNHNFLTKACQTAVNFNFQVQVIIGDYTRTL